MFAYLIYPALLIALLGFYVFVAWTTGRWLAIRLGRRYVVPVALVAAIGTPVAWIYGSAISFSHACEWAPATQVFTRAAQSEDGFLVNDLGYQWFAGHKSSFAPTQLIDSGVFAFYERPYGWDRSPKFRRQFTRSFENVDSLQSRYVFELAAPVRVQTWWHAPIYSADYVVREISTGNTLAKGTDIVFGGGILGEYMHYFGRNQDAAFLSCGYIDREIGEWRPNSAWNPRFAKYMNTDTAVLLATLKGNAPSQLKKNDSRRSDTRTSR